MVFFWEKYARELLEHASGETQSIPAWAATKAGGNIPFFCQISRNQWKLCLQGKRTPFLAQTKRKDWIYFQLMNQL